MAALPSSPSSSGSAGTANDFTIQIATANGSGSQTANLVLLRALFQMGVPVSGKNMFPSNIAGLPTWYTVRASRRGYPGRKAAIDLLVAINPETAREDVLGLPPGSAVVYDEPLALSGHRDDVTAYPVPFDKLVATVCPDAKLRRLVRNMIYDGVLSELLGIEMAEMEAALRKQLGRKAKAFELNLAALHAGAAYAREHIGQRPSWRAERMNATAGQILVDGNAAAAMGCLMAGCTVVAWYPITPSSSLCESLNGYLKQYRTDADGRATYAVVQAEDEISALGMVIGASWAGARAMTATSGPGLSLMAEAAGLAYYAEVPAVVIDVQRLGPSTGLPTRTAQGDVLMAASLSHGDTRHPVLFPGSVGECYTMAIEAFDLAERLQTPVFVLMDLDLGMNTWRSDPFPYPDRPLDRGKVLTAEKLREIGTAWGRYHDVDGDGVGWRTLPGDGLPASFTRGSGHNEHALYSERAADYRANVERLDRKVRSAAAIGPQPVCDEPAGARVGLVAYGTTDAAMQECRDQLREEHGVETAYCRVRAYPFSEAVGAFIDRYDRVYVVEQNRDGQLLSLLRMDPDTARVGKLRSVCIYDGLPVDARSLSDGVVAQEGARA